MTHSQYRKFLERLVTVDKETGDHIFLATERSIPPCYNCSEEKYARCRDNEIQCFEFLHYANTGLNAVKLKVEVEVKNADRNIPDVNVDDNNMELEVINHEQTLL